MKRTVSRRELLASTMLATGFGLTAARSAAALSLQPADAEARRLYLSACGGADRATHEKLVAEIESRLADATREEIEAAIRQTVCPICGCALVAP